MSDSSERVGGILKPLTLRPSQVHSKCRVYSRSILQNRAPFHGRFEIAASYLVYGDVKSRPAARVSIRRDLAAAGVGEMRAEANTKDKRRSREQGEPNTDWREIVPYPSNPNTSKGCHVTGVSPAPAARHPPPHGMNWVEPQAMNFLFTTVTTRSLKAPLRFFDAQTS